MGVLIIIGSTVVAGTIIHRLYASFAPPPMATTPPLAPASLASPPMAPLAARLAPGEQIEGIAAAGPDLAVWVSGPAGARVLLLDPVSGTLRVGLSTAK